ncbi:MAG TPA: hypothetical protein VEG08_11640 [Terriglobales bacterium]|nr:hypothetical protein [Terriglobales bacterium]
MRMIRALPLAVFLLLVALSLRSSAQMLSRTPHLTAPPKVPPGANLPSSIAHPPPSVKRQKAPSPAKELDYFAGVWHETGGWKKSVLGPGGWFSTDFDNRWQKGHLTSHWTEEATGGSGAGETIYAYDSKERVYTCHAADTKGTAEDWEATLKADTWTWTGKVGRLGDGRTVRGRYIQKEVSPTHYTSRYEISVQGGKWTKVMDGYGYKK